MAEHPNDLNPETGEPERESRSHRMFAGTICSDRMGEQPIVVRNISPHGLSARMRSHLPQPGERVTIALGGELLEAKVQWVRKNCFGVRLSREIDPSGFASAGTSWESALQPFERGHVFDQFRPVSDPRRPGFKIR